MYQYSLLTRYGVHVSTSPTQRIRPLWHKPILPSNFINLRRRLSTDRLWINYR